MAEGLYLAKIINSGGGIIANLSGIAVDDLITKKLEAIAGETANRGSRAIAERSHWQKTSAGLDDPLCKPLSGSCSIEAPPNGNAMRSFAGAPKPCNTSNALAAIKLLLRPMFDLRPARSLKADEPFVRAAGAGDWASARASLSRYLQIPDQCQPGRSRKIPPRYSRIIPENYLPIQILQLNWLWIAQRRARPRCLWRPQLYRADHSKWPQTLEDLHPDYLSMLPPDPFGNGNGIGYILEPIAGPWGANRPMVYTNQASRLLGAPPAVSVLRLAKWRRAVAGCVKLVAASEHGARGETRVDQCRLSIINHISPTIPGNIASPNTPAQNHISGITTPKAIARNGPLCVDLATTTSVLAQ